MDPASKDRTKEQAGPNLRDEVDGVGFRTLAKGITTHPLIRGGRPGIKGTGLMVTDMVAAQKYHKLAPEDIAEHYAIRRVMVEDGLAYYAAHTDYIDTDMEIDSLNDDQLAEAQYGTRPDTLLSRRKPVF